MAPPARQAAARALRLKQTKAKGETACRYPAAEDSHTPHTHHTHTQGEARAHTHSLHSASSDAGESSSGWDQTQTLTDQRGKLKQGGVDLWWVVRGDDIVCVSV